MARRTGSALALILTIVLSGCIAATPDVRTAASSPLSPLPAPTATPGALVLTIIHTNDTWGYVDPCG